jgi:AraC-like DNA-binding protein
MVMASSLPGLAADGLERSCGPSGRDVIRIGTAIAGLERIEAFFSGHAYDPHRHDTYAVGLTLWGVQSFDYRGERRDSLAGRAIVLHPDEVHDGRSGVETGFAYRMIYVAPRLIQAALGGRRSLPFVRNPVTDDPRMVAAAMRALDGIERGFEPLEADQVLLTLAEAMLALSDGSALRDDSACGQAVDRARAFLDAHFGRVVGSQELEQVTGLDRWQLARHFRARLGTSPYRYLTMRRLDHARAALRAGTPLAEAAAMSGFADQSHMNRQFKRAYGLAPGRWRAINTAA